VEWFDFGDRGTGTPGGGGGGKGLGKRVEGDSTLFRRVGEGVRSVGGRGSERRRVEATFGIGGKGVERSVVGGGQGGSLLPRLLVKGARVARHECKGQE